MDFSTNIVNLGWVRFEAEGSRVTPITDYFADQPSQLPALSDPRRRYPDPERPTDSLPPPIRDNWSRIGRASFSRPLYARLLRIAGRSNGWRGTSSIALTSNSLRNFLEFWRRVRSVAVEPELALAPDGCLHVEWFKSRQRHLDAKFADQKVIFGLFNGRNILEGAEDRDSVVAILTSHRSKPLTWSST
jgi:hypothetical protein